MNQAEIDELLRDSAFEDSEAQMTTSNRPEKEEKVEEPVADSYGQEQFESYDESRRTLGKNNSKNDFEQSKKYPKQKKQLEAIKEQVTITTSKKQVQSKPSTEKPKAKTGIYFYPPKQPNPSSSVQKKSLPYNYARLHQRQKQLLLTTLTEENKQLKQSLRTKESEYKKLQNIYKIVLSQQSKAAPSVREATLEKQLTILQGKYDKLQQLFKLEKDRNSLKGTRAHQTFIPQEKASQREDELLEIIEKLKERLISTNNQLKTLTNKMNQGQNYIDELRRKLKRIQQLQNRIDKMSEQAQNDRQFIEILKDKNKKLEDQIRQQEKQRKSLEFDIKRLQLGTATQTDIRKELEEVRRQKDMLEQNLRQLTTNLMSKVKNNFPQRPAIQDSGQLLRY